MNFTPTGQWTYNYSDYEIWDNELSLSREDAIEHGKVAYDDSFYIGEVENVNFTVDDLNSDYWANRIVEDLEQTLYEEVGDVAEYWKTTDHIDSLAARLNFVVLDWITNVAKQPDCYAIKNVEYIEE